MASKRLFKYPKCTKFAQNYNFLSEVPTLVAEIIDFDIFLMTKPLLKKAFLASLRLIAPVFPMDSLRNWGNKGVFLPFYHLVSDEECPHIKHLYPVKSTFAFERDLDFILKYYKPISLQELMEGNSPKHCHLTFDDGLRQCYDTVMPILLRKGIPATFFLNPGFIDNKGLMFRYKTSLLIEKNNDKSLLKLEYKDTKAIDDLAQCMGVSFDDFLKDYQPYLTSSQINEMVGKGFTFGGHSIDHPEFRLISFEEQCRQMKQSVDFVQKEFRQNLRAFAFPFTDFGIKQDLFEFAKKEAKLDLTFGCAGIKHSKFDRHYQRFAMEASPDAPHKMIKAEYLKSGII